MVRLPVEYDLGPDLPTLRGERSVSPAAPGALILCVHDLGHDIDELGPLRSVLARQGFVVDAIDLPGHGLSDGDENDLAAVGPALAALVASLRTEVGRLGLITVGSSATLASTLGEDHGVPAQVAISPVLDERLPLEPRERATRLIVQGEHANLVGTRTQQYFRHVLGEKLMVYNTLLRDDVAAAGRIDAVADHVGLFFRRYLLPGPRQVRPIRPPAAANDAAPDPREGPQ